MVRDNICPRLWLSVGAATCAICFGSINSSAQSSGYAVGENGPSDSAAAATNAVAGPVRMARFSYTQGNVTWRPDESTDWASAPNNLPLKQGAQVWVAAGGRAEVQFDDGSYLRLGSGAIATIKVLFSDAEGEFTEISLTNGLAMMQIKHNMSMYQVDTPLVSAKADGPARVRIGVGSGVDIAVLDGEATLEGEQGKATLNHGDYLVLSSSGSGYNVRPIPSGADSWETWNQDRNRMLDASAESLTNHNVPENIRLVAGNLDEYGTWRTDPTYGDVWCPTAVDANWRPYYAGHWVWVNPFGWTWCSDEPWGWAPYHYGTWAHSRYGWAWCPGPVRQYWSPAVVHFSEYDGNVAWCALAPSEVRYPSEFAVGFRRGNWETYFSIGMAGCYYPGGSTYCVGRAFNTVVVNRTTYVTRVEVAGGGRSREVAFVSNNNSYLSGRAFVPVNARSAAGAIVTSQGAFGGRGAYNRLNAGSVTAFSEGHSIGAPIGGRAPVAGPPLVRPTTASLVPNRVFTIAGAQTPPAANRPLVRTPLSGRVSAGLPEVRGSTRGIGSQLASPGIGRGPVNQPALPGSGRGPVNQPALPGSGRGPVNQPVPPGSGKGPVNQPALPGSGRGPVNQPALPGSGRGPVNQTGSPTPGRTPGGQAVTPGSGRSTGGPPSPGSGSGTRPTSSGTPTGSRSPTPTDGHGQSRSGAGGDGKKTSGGSSSGGAKSGAGSGAGSGSDKKNGKDKNGS